MKLSGRPPKRQRKLAGGPPRKPSKYNLFIKRMTKGGKMTLKQAAARWRKGGARAKPSTRAAPRRTAPRRTAPRSRPKPIGGKKKVAGFNTQKIFKVIRTAALIMPVASVVMGAGTPQQKISQVLANFTGYDINTGTFAAHRLAKGWGPFVVANLVTHGIPKLNSFIKGVV